MAQSNRERVGRVLDVLQQGLASFVEREMQSVYKDKWVEVALDSLRDERWQNKRGKEIHFDTQALLNLVWDQWQGVFSKKLGPGERTLVSELRGTRNKWAHQEPFSTDDAYRACDSAGRLLHSITAAEEAATVERHKQELLRQKFEEQAKKEISKASTTPIEGGAAAGYKPWRDVIMPHPDVASGRYQQAEFAADLGQVHRSEGADEYKNPRQFFERTFITDGLKNLLSSAILRIAGVGGDPVVELQTNFGGGKTHSMLALFHLFSGVGVSDLPGIEVVIESSGGVKPTKANRAVLVGTDLSAAAPRTKPDGTVVHTLWGEMAWQLLGSQGYKIVEESDKRGVSPGSDLLRQVFQKAAPCLVLIDEWVAFVRLLHKVDGLAAGSFDSNLTFAQSLTEAAKAVPKTLLVASIPASDIETGGEAGQYAVGRLRNIFGRIESAWRPASAEEGFEIVRRRLFQPLVDPASCSSRDAVVKAFVEMYRTQTGEFPSACKEADYERRLRTAYPIHPELFDRLFNDWSSLEKFQRTRGVLRLMAAVIHHLWERQDRSLLILPSSVPIDAPEVQYELTRYVEDSWIPIIEKEVDGGSSLPLALDRENPNLGRYSACRRVARTLYLGSAATLHSPNKGLEDQQIKLGCVQPGEAIGTFGDGLRRLTDSATHVYVDGRRYWFSTQPSVMRLAQDRATQFDLESDVFEEILRRLRYEVRDARNRGDFSGVHVAPQDTSEVPDEKTTRLVILSPTLMHTARDNESAARKEAERILEQKGGGQRLYKNCLLFLAADRARLSDLESAVRSYLAWKSIEDEKENLNLDAFQTNQAATKKQQFDDTVRQRIPEAFQWLLVPSQERPSAEKPSSDIDWQDIRLQGQEALALRASKKLRDQKLLICSMSGLLLKMEIDEVPLWRGNHVLIQELAENFARYLYLSRLKDSEIILRAIEDGLSLTTWLTDSFAYADGWDEQTQRYKGLRAGQLANLSFDRSAVLVKPDVAVKQMEADADKMKKAIALSTSTTNEASEGSVTGARGAVASTVTVQPEVYTRFHGSAMVDATRFLRDSQVLVDEVLQHLTGLVGSKVKVTLEIEAEFPDGVPQTVMRTVNENCRTLQFVNYEFEKE